MATPQTPPTPGGPGTEAGGTGETETAAAEARRPLPTRSPDGISATLAGTTSSEDFYSVDPDSAIDEAAAADPASEGGTPAEAAGGQALGVQEAPAPATDIPPAPAGRRRTRSGLGDGRRVTTSDEPVATVVTVPPVQADQRRRSSPLPRRRPRTRRRRSDGGGRARG